MKSKYHKEMTRNALQTHFSESALKAVIQANIWQDRPRNQFGHDYIHFDGSAFEAGYSYIESQKYNIVAFIKSGQYDQARKAFGQITHTWQDFYSHSNYVKLWLKGHPKAKPAEIDPSDPTILNNKALMSGKNYGLMEFISMLPLISKWIVPRMPVDSHAQMNMDDPQADPLFHYGIAAGEKRTAQLWLELRDLLLKKDITHAQIDRFLGRGSDNPRYNN